MAAARPGLLHPPDHSARSQPPEIVVARQKGFWWCFAWSLKPASPGGAILGWFTALHFCSSRAWYYVRLIT